MDMWGIYTHCSQSEDPDVMPVDAQRLSLAVEVKDPAADPISPESEEPAPKEPSVRLPADPAAMAAACALCAGHVAQGSGRLYLAREMFHMIVTHFPQPRSRYYATQSRKGLEQLDAARSGWFQPQDGYLEAVLTGRYEGDLPPVVGSFRGEACASVRSRRPPSELPG
ncbi:MAG TPA: hypothetical protein VKP13_17590 [Nitrospira sp.]|nr:hypothetical protein [Nitrospira sp.]